MKCNASKTKARIITVISTTVGFCNLLVSVRRLLGSKNAEHIYFFEKHLKSIEQCAIIRMIAGIRDDSVCSAALNGSPGVYSARL